MVAVIVVHKLRYLIIIVIGGGGGQIGQCHTGSIYAHTNVLLLLLHFNRARVCLLLLIMSYSSEQG